MAAAAGGDEEVAGGGVVADEKVARLGVGVPAQAGVDKGAVVDGGDGDDGADCFAEGGDAFGREPEVRVCEVGCGEGDC